jgi:hypothetical protein
MEPHGIQREGKMVYTNFLLEQRMGNVETVLNLEVKNGIFGRKSTTMMMFGMFNENVVFHVESEN